MAVVAEQLGYAEESGGYGSPTTPVLWVPQATLAYKAVPDKLESEAQRAGRYTTHSEDWANGKIDVTLDVTHKMTDRNFKPLLKHSIGIETGAGPYTNTPGTLDGLSLTAQAGVSTTSNTVEPFTFNGCKINEWSIGLEHNAIAEFSASMIGRSQILGRVTSADGNTTTTNPNITSVTAAFSADDVGKPITGTNIPANTYIYSVTSPTAAVLGNQAGTATVNATGTATTTVFTIGIALASASYPANLNPVTFNGASVLVGGNAIPVKSLNFGGKNQLVPRFLCYGNYSHLTLEPMMGTGSKREYMIGITPEFTSTTEFKRIVNGTMFAVVITIGVGSNTYALTANCRADGDPPKSSGLKIAEQPLQYKCVGSTDAAAFTLVHTL